MQILNAFFWLLNIREAKSVLVCFGSNSQRAGMARYRSFLFSEATLGDRFAILDARESHHLVRVFRAKVGETVELLDGAGCKYQGRIEVADAKAARVVIESVVEQARPAVAMTLIQSVPKGKQMDLILRMATEIGVASIQPVFTDQGEVQIKGDRLASKVEKWRLTMIESCKQCGLAYLPELAEPCSLREYLQTNSAQEGIVASLEEGSLPLLKHLQGLQSPAALRLAVGPEGDFSSAEYDLLREAGFAGVRLGANVLRAETAAAYVLSVVDQFCDADG